MKCAIISLGSKSSQWIADSCRKYFSSVDEIDLREIEVKLSNKNLNVFYKGQSLKNYDCIYARGSFRYAPILSTITSALQEQSYMPLKSVSFIYGHNKFLTQLRFQKKKVPTPEAYIAATADAAKKILKKVNFPIIIKLPSGTHGKGVLFAESYASASSMCDALKVLNQSFIIQEYIETEGSDIRAIVAGEKVVASMKRQASAEEKRANIHAGGKGKAITLTPEIQKIAIEAARAMGCDICAVDLLESTKGALVLEVNLSPGLQGITKITNQDIASKIALALYSNTKKFIGEKKKSGVKELLKDISKPGKEQEIISTLNFKGEKILLPSIVTKLSGFKVGKEYTIKVKKGKLFIE